MKYLLSSLWVIFVISMSTLTGVSETWGNTFCNMDESGGEAGRAGQRSAASAAAVFLGGASTAFEMFANLELHSAGDRQALKAASELSSKSLEQLSRSSKDFRAVVGARDSIRAIDSVLKKLKVEDYNTAFTLSRFPMDSPISRQILEAFQKAGSAGVMTVCATTIEDLTKKERPMGEVFAIVRTGEAPVAEKIWAAVAQWNETFIKGRIVSSIFKVSSQYKP